MASLTEVVRDLVKGLMPSDPVHGYPHVERVLKIARRLAEGLKGVDTEVLELAVLLHDLGRKSGAPGNHAEKSARLAESLLKALGYPEDRVKRVVEAIIAHSFTSGVKPKSLEAMILSDADKIDALGAVGIARVLMYSGAIGRGLEESIQHFKVKILKLPSYMYTEKGREEALKRVKLVKEFVEALEGELILNSD